MCLVSWSLAVIVKQTVSALLCSIPGLLQVCGPIGGGM